MKKISYSFHSIFLCFSFLLAQNSENLISGIVYEPSGDFPAVNVEVVNENSGATTFTDEEGKFAIQAKAGDILQIISLNYPDYSFTMPNASSVEITLEDGDKALSEIVVVGYGTQTAGTTTGSISQLNSEEILETPQANAMQSVQGKVAGLNIITNDTPGVDPVVILRGLTTVTGGRSPLYVVDGIEMSSINQINPNDIKTMDVLKDASSLAIYGNKGASGVIIITTKSGTKEGMNIDYDGYFGVKQILKKVKMADSYRFAYYNNYAVGDINYFRQENQPNNTNWLDEITHDGYVSNNALTISGGSDLSSYSIGGAYYSENGILRGNIYNRTVFNSKTSQKLFNKKIRLSQYINLSLNQNSPKPLSTFTNAYKQSPIMPVRYANGRYAMPFVNDLGLNDIYGDKYNNVANPVAQLELFNEKNKGIGIIGNFGFEWDLLPSLTFKSSFGGEYTNAKGYSFEPYLQTWLSQNPALIASDYPDDYTNALWQRRSETFRYNWDNYFTFNKKFGNNYLNIVAGISKSKARNGDYLSAKRYDVPEQSNFWSLDFSDVNEVQEPIGNYIQNRHSTPLVAIGYFGRLEYSYKNKYLLNASIRRDGVSDFQKGKKWGIFPGISAGWVISKESFFNIGFINFLKLRGGYGEIGNAASTGSSLNNVLFGGGYLYPFGGVPVNGINQPYQVDPNLTWETIKEYDFGMDFQFAKQAIKGSLDFYNKKTTDVILPVRPPPVLSPGAVLVNTGTVENKGVEVSLSYSKVFGNDFQLNISGNYAYNKNELTEVKNRYFQNMIGGSLGNGQYTKEVRVGSPIGAFYVFQTQGYNSSGLFNYSDDRVNAGSYIPTSTYGLNFNFGWKGAYLTAEFYGVAGNKVYNGKKAQRFGGENIEYDYLDSFYTSSNPNADNPAPNNEIPKASTYFVESGDYLKIRNISLGYVFNSPLKNINSINLYATAINPFIFTKYTGFSPEVAGDGNPLGNAGIELDAYPTNKSFLIGVKFNMY